jgi:hypothetical protein
MSSNLFQIDKDANAFTTFDIGMNRQDEGPPERTSSQKGPFARWNKPRWGLFLLLVLAGNVLVATLAWIIVRLVTG